MFRHMGALLVATAVTVGLFSPSESSANAPPDPIEKQRCCSHHGGVAGGWDLGGR
jgi:hypothetical protein